MPTLNTIVEVATKPLPRMISPRAHAMVDYLIVGSCLAAAVTFWRRNKRAALAAVICGGAELAVSLLTAYPGGARKVIHFNARRDINLGLAAMIAAMPEVLAFEDGPEKKFFLAEGVLITAANELTKFTDPHKDAKRRARAA